MKKKNLRFPCISDTLGFHFKVNPSEVSLRFINAQSSSNERHAILLMAQLPNSADRALTSPRLHLRTLLQPTTDDADSRPAFLLQPNNFVKRSQLGVSLILAILISISFFNYHKIVAYPQLDQSNRNALIVMCARSLSIYNGWHDTITVMRRRSEYT